MEKQPNPHLQRYLRLNEMARDEERPQERRELLKKIALDMVTNTTNIEGISFMAPQEHTIFMAALIEHGQKVTKEVKQLEVVKG